MTDYRSITSIVSSDERFHRVRALMDQWHQACDRERLAKLVVGVSGEDDEVSDSPMTTAEINLLDGLSRQTRAAELVFLAAAETFFLMGMM